MGPENSRVWQPLKKFLRGRGVTAWRIENKNGEGMPDVVASYDNDDGRPLKLYVWLELKYAAAPTSDNIHIGLRKVQRVWLRKARRDGHACAILAKVGDRFYLWSTVEAFDMCAKTSNWNELRRHGQSRATIAEMWELIQELI